MKNQNYDGLKSAADAAALAGVNYWSFLKAIKANQVPSVKLPGNRVGVTLEDAQAYAETVSK